MTRLPRWAAVMAAAVQMTQLARAQDGAEQVAPATQIPPAAQEEPARTTPVGQPPQYAPPPPQYAPPPPPAPQLAREQPYREGFALGAAIGKGLGLFGAFGSYRVTDGFGFEAGLGTRILVIEVTGYRNSWTETYWPLAGMFKGQWFLRRQGRYQSGVEAGALYFEDLGVGGEVAYFGRLRLGRRVYCDFDLGGAFFPSAKEHAIEYLVNEHPYSRSLYENAAAGTTPFVLMWGLGIGVVI